MIEGKLGEFGIMLQTGIDERAPGLYRYVIMRRRSQTQRMTGRTFEIFTKKGVAVNIDKENDEVPSILWAAVCPPP
jgi:hypothetical protein